MNDICPQDLSGISAYELHEKLGLNTLPYDPFDIARQLEIEVNQDLNMDNMDLSGSITNKNGKVTIWINPLDSETRQRFTLAHELGHYINDILVDGKIEIKDTPDTLYRDGRSHPCEVKANNFAAMLLMPKNQVISNAIDLINNSPNQVISARNLVSELAEIFQVSKPAMLVRLKKLRIIDQEFQM